MDKYEESLKPRNITVQSYELYCGAAGLYNIGQLGCARKQNLLALWWKHFYAKKTAETTDAAETECLWEVCLSISNMTQWDISVMLKTFCVEVTVTGNDMTEPMPSI